MSTTEITSKIEALKDLESLIEEAKAEAEALRDEIKTEMLNRDTEEMEAGQYIVRWTSVLTQRFDTTAFKKVMPDVYKEYTKQVSSRRFSINKVRNKFIFGRASCCRETVFSFIQHPNLLRWQCINKERTMCGYEQLLTISRANTLGHFERQVFHILMI